MDEEKKINAFQVAFIMLGTIIGAGFASGREIWVYFGSYGQMGYLGLVIALITYLLIAFGSAMIGMKEKTSAFEKVITPSGMPKIEKIVEYYMTFILWAVLLSMSSAGGAVGQLQFGWPPFVGGLIVTVLVLATVFGNFERVSKVFTYVMPVLMVVMIVACICFINTDFQVSEFTDIPKHSSLTPTWYLGAFVYICYSTNGTLCMSAKCASEAKSKKNMYGGICLAAVIMTILMALMMIIQCRYPSFSEAMDMPMLGFAARSNPVLNVIYSLSILACIYAAGTTNFYNFSTKIPDRKNKKLILTGLGFLAYACGLVGFKNIVNYMFSVLGFLGIVILALMVIHFIQDFKGNKN